MRMPAKQRRQAVHWFSLAVWGILAAVHLGCIEQDGRGSQASSATEQSAGETAAAPAGDRSGPPGRSAAESPDLKHYPQPEVLPGRELVAGPVEVLPEMRRPERGGACPLEFTVRGDTTIVTVQSIPINCCTERVAPSVSVRGDTAEIHIWEYMTEFCECFHQRAVRFALAPFDTTGLHVLVYLNDRARPCWESGEE